MYSRVIYQECQPGPGKVEATAPIAPASKHHRTSARIPLAVSLQLGENRLIRIEAQCFKICSRDGSETIQYKWKRYRYECSASEHNSSAFFFTDGSTNHALERGVHMTHGAKCEL